ncbi:hypothetical protein SAI_1274 [Streptococcus agalactiae H36B]|nr:hypothetical protein SAI_1274 [Streptococcus agalactiae H36B]
MGIYQARKVLALPRVVFTFMKGKIYQMGKVSVYFFPPVNRIP